MTELRPLNVNGKKAPAEKTLGKTICIEWLRLIAFLALSGLFIAANIFSKKFVFLPEEEESGRLLSSLRGDVASEGGRRLGFVMFGVEHPYLDMKDTTIYKLFGFPHACSFIDFNPAKEVGAILLPFFTLPMTIFLILAHYRNQLVYRNVDPKNDETKNLYWYSRITTYYTVFVISLSHLWFVNDPEASYPKGFGFVGHYIPYALFQIALGLTAIMQVKYDIIIDKIPYGVSPTVARGYVVYVALLTMVCQAMVIAILMGKPIIDARNGGWELTLFQVLAKLWVLASLGVPIASSIWTIRFSGDTNSFQMAIQ